MDVFVYVELIVSYVISNIGRKSGKDERTKKTTTTNNMICSLPAKFVTCSKYSVVCFTLLPFGWRYNLI